MTLIDAMRNANVNVTAQHDVQIAIARNRAYVWVNVDGVCALRIKTPNHVMLTIEDMRNSIPK